MNIRFLIVVFLFVYAGISIFSQNSSFHDVQKLAFNDRPPMDDFMYDFPWLDSYKKENTICNRIMTPVGFERVKFNPDTFEHWLQHLPLKSGTPKVLLYDGSPKWNQQAHCYVVDIETGSKDLQQCADALMRLRAEFLFMHHKDDIHFNYTNGATSYYKKWRSGLMPVPKGKEISWVASSKAGEGYSKFKTYLIQVYNYAGTHSLDKELTKVPFRELTVGDIIIEGGFPGHGIIVVDMATNPRTNEKIFMLVQSYMPAQDIQILRNPNNSKYSPWYSLDEIDYILDTPEWEFDTDDLRRWN